MKIYKFLGRCFVVAGFGGSIILILLTLARVASEPAVHPAPYAVRHDTSSVFFSPDQGRATFVSPSGSVPDLFSEVRR